MSGSRWAMFAMQVRVEQRVFWRNLSSVFFTFVLPLVVLVALWMGDDPVDGVPFIVALAVISTAFQGLGIQLAMHRDQGVLKGLMSTPLPPGVLIAGKVASIALVVLVELVLVVSLSALLFDASFPDRPLALVAFALLGTGCFVALAFAVASLIPTSESAPAVMNGAYLAMLMLTVLLGTIDGVPDLLRGVGDLTPLSALVAPVKAAWLGPWDGFPWGSLAVLLAWLAIGAAWTTRRFRWDPAGAA